MDSFKDFPDLVSDTKKKTVFEGVSLASKLKEVLAAEEEAAIQKRLKKGDTPEQILREACVVLPLKHSKRKSSGTNEIIVPDWLLDHTPPVVFPSFRPKSLQQSQQERYWARLGIDPTQTKLYDNDEAEEEEDDTESVLSVANQKEDLEVLSEEE